MEDLAELTIFKRIRKKHRNLFYQNSAQDSNLTEIREQTYVFF